MNIIMSLIIAIITIVIVFVLFALLFEAPRAEEVEMGFKASVEEKEIEAFVNVKTDDKNLVRELVYGFLVFLLIIITFFIYKFIPNKKNRLEKKNKNDSKRSLED